MKNQLKTASLRLTEKFDLQLRDILEKEIKQIRKVRNNVLSSFKDNDLNGGGLQVA
ncbi:hypothetical protein [Pedobacter sp. BS3]|uniref:hypothetical protein n=1 Tax=Pedobacter sp. BS3 TaxID=2567937 RepID=UPI001658F4F4|nr:hypothetical protein [Pedobacter sp. BS3]